MQLQSSNPSVETDVGTRSFETDAEVHERELDAILAALPRERSSADFTPRAIERLDNARRRDRHWRSLAAAAALIVCGAAGSQWHEYREREQAVDRLVELRLEYRMLEEQLEILAREADRRRPVVYLGSDDQVEYVLDLSRLTTAPRTPTALPTEGRPGAGRSRTTLAHY